MKKVFSMLVLAAAMFSFLNANAQYPNVNNADFEAWTGLTTSSEEPTSWSSFKTASGTFSAFAAQQVQRSTIIRPGTPGTYSAKIWAKNISGTIANGNLTTGQINMGSMTPASTSNYNITRTASADFSEALNASPDSLVVWVRTVIANASHQPRIHAIIHDTHDMRDPIDAGSTSHVVAEATLNYSSTNDTWVRKSIPFVYGGAASNPAWILISISTCGSAGTGTDGDIVYIDDLQLVYNPTLTTGTVTAGPYYVAASTSASISIPFTLTGTMYAGNTVTAQLSDASGSFASPITLGTLSTTSSGTISGTIPANTPSGAGYRIRVVSTNYAITAADNGSDIQIALVSNTVLPAANQTIEAGTTGTANTVTESIAPISREWKYGTTSSGPYASFTPAETSTTYTPSFATAGNYYIVCESTWPGSITLTSNELYVLVADNAITPAAAQNIAESTNGAQLTLTETPVGTSREWKFATVSGGPYSSFTPAETNSTYTPFFTTQGTYYVIAQNIFDGVTITSPEITVVVYTTVGIEDQTQEVVSLSWDNHQLRIDLAGSEMVKPTLIVTDMNGRIVANTTLTSKSLNVLDVNVAPGIYGYSIQDGNHNISGKILNK